MNLDLLLPLPLSFHPFFLTPDPCTSLLLFLEKTHHHAQKKEQANSSAAPILGIVERDYFFSFSNKSNPSADKR